MESQILGAVQAHFAATREHSFEAITVDGQSKECCTKCGRLREDLRKDTETYFLVPCRGLVG